MSEIKKNSNGKIKVADITLAQLSRGLYRSNATVFKELINNSYDADAESVRINTNFPSFDYISIVDTGKGMPIEKFINHFEEKGIGSSTKRRGDIGFTEKYKRPVIGRLGIGMMAIGQICHSFELESHYIDNTTGKKIGYKAEIILTDDSIPTIESEISKQIEKGREIDVGEWKYEIIEFDEEKRGFRIYSNDVRGTFRREMNESYENEEGFKGVPFSLNEILQILYGSRSVRDCKPYLETIWELCTLCPLPFFDNPFSPIYFTQHNSIEIEKSEVSDFLNGRQKDLESYNFKVFFDGIELKKLIRLPTNSNVKSKVFFVDFDRKVFDTRLKFQGYIFSQISKAIKPFELNGIQIRLRNVGIGGYDRTFLKYYNQIETIRSKWVSGEIFVDFGLEAALNIDRDSFNEHEEHYKALQKHLHDYLNKVFDETNKTATKNRTIVKKAKITQQSKKLKEYVIESSKGKFQLNEINDPEVVKSVEVDDKKGIITLNNGTKNLRTQKADQLYKIIEIAYHISQNMDAHKEIKHEKFMELVKKALKELI